MTVKRFVCDASEWEFAIAQDGRELVAVLFRRGERFGPEFRGEDQADVQRSIARWLLLFSDKAGALH